MINTLNGLYGLNAIMAAFHLLKICDNIFTML